MKAAIFDKIGVKCGRYTIFLSEFAIRYEYVSFAGGTPPRGNLGQHHLHAIV